AEAVLALDRVAGMLEDLRIDLGDELRLVEVVRADLDRRLRGLRGRLRRRCDRARCGRLSWCPASSAGGDHHDRGHPERQQARGPHVVSPPPLTPVTWGVARVP